MLTIKAYSDLHLDHDVRGVKKSRLAHLWQPPMGDEDAQSVLVLAGDIWEGLRPLMFAGDSWLTIVASRFAAVIVVLGNHDAWGENLDYIADKWRQAIASMRLENVHLLEVGDGPQQGSVVISGLRFIGGTLWTDMDKGNPQLIQDYDYKVDHNGKPAWPDHRLIRTGPQYKKFKAAEWIARHRKTVTNLQVALQMGDEPVCLVTHHAPSLLSVQPREDDPLGHHLFASDLTDLIRAHPRIQTAIHGHVHVRLDYIIPGTSTRLVCNPRGYSSNGELVPDFDPSGTKINFST